MAAQASSKRPAKVNEKPVALDKPAPAAKPKKLSYKVQRELDLLPGRIESLENDIDEIQTALGDPALYRESPEKVAELDAKRLQLEDDLADAYKRWEALEP